MPTVDAYKPNQVNLRPVADNPLRGPDANAFGGEIGQALTGAGRAVGQVAEVAQQFEDKKIETRTREADIGMSTFVLNKRTELAQYKGLDYDAQAPAAIKAIEDYGREAVGKASNRLEQQMISDTVARNIAMAKSQITERRMQEVDTADKVTRAAHIDNLGNLAATDYGGPTFAVHTRDMRAAMVEDFGKQGIHDPAVIEDAFREKMNKLHHAGISGQIENGDYAGATRNIVNAQALGELNADTANALRKDAREMRTLYGAQAATSAVETGGGGGVGAGPTGPMAATVAGVVKSEGGSDADVRTMVAIGLIENGGRLNPPKNGSSTGAMQMHPDTFAANAKPGEDINNPADNIRAAYRNVRKETAALTRILGRAPAPWEIYLAHQQGAGGGPALLKAPREMNAVEALTPAYKGNAAMARKAITGNGGTTNMTVGDFLDVWQGKVASRLRGSNPPTAGATPQTPGGELPDREAYVAQVLALAPDHDPRTLKAYRQQAEARYADMKTQKTDREEKAVDAAQPLLRDNSIRTVDQFISANPRIWQALPETTKTTIQNHYGTGGFAKDSDPMALAALQTMQVRNPQAFIDMDLTGQTSKLSNGDYSKMLEDQKTMRLGGGAAKDHLVTQEKIMGVSSALLRAVGIDPGSKRPGVAERVAAFQSSMLRAVDIYKNQNKGLPPDDKALHSIADSLLLSGESEGGLFGGKKARAFEAARDKPFHLDVPSKAREQIISGYTKRFGRAPSVGQIEADYRQMHAAGIYP